MPAELGRPSYEQQHWGSAIAVVEHIDRIHKRGSSLLGGSSAKGMNCSSWSRSVPHAEGCDTRDINLTLEAVRGCWMELGKGSCAIRETVGVVMEMRIVAPNGVFGIS